MRHFKGEGDLQGTAFLINSFYTKDYGKEHDGLRLVRVAKQALIKCRGYENSRPVKAEHQKVEGFLGGQGGEGFWRCVLAKAHIQQSLHVRDDDLIFNVCIQFKAIDML